MSTVVNGLRHENVIKTTEKGKQSEDRKLLDGRILLFAQGLGTATLESHSKTENLQ